MIYRLDDQKFPQNTSMIYTKEYIDYRVDNIVKQLYDYNRTLFQDFQGFINENQIHDPLKTTKISGRISKPFFAYEKASLRQLSNFLLDKDTLLDPYFTKITSHPDHIEAIFVDLEHDVKICKDLLTKTRRSFIRYLHQVHHDPLNKQEVFDNKSYL